MAGADGEYEQVCMFYVSVGLPANQGRAKARLLTAAVDGKGAEEGHTVPLRELGPGWDRIKHTHLGLRLCSIFRHNHM